MNVFRPGPGAATLGICSIALVLACGAPPARRSANGCGADFDRCIRFAADGPLSADLDPSRIVAAATTRVSPLGDKLTDGPLVLRSAEARPSLTTPADFRLELYASPSGKNECTETPFPVAVVLTSQNPGVEVPDPGLLIRRGEVLCARNLGDGSATSMWGEATGLIWSGYRPYD